MHGNAHVARARRLPDRERPRQADLRRPVPPGEPVDAREREEPRTCRRDRRHPRALRPRGRGARPLEAVPGRAGRRAGRGQGLARRAGRERRAAAGDQQGRLAGDRRDPLHDDERVPFVERRRRYVPRRVVRDRRAARGREEHLLRRRHVRLRRHAADRAALPTRPRRPPDRRLVHDGPARRPHWRSSCSGTRVASRVTSGRSRSSRVRPTGWRSSRRARRSSESSRETIEL